MSIFKQNHSGGDSEVLGSESLSSQPPEILIPVSSSSGQLDLKLDHQKSKWTTASTAIKVDILPPTTADKFWLICFSLLRWLTAEELMLLCHIKVQDKTKPNEQLGKASFNHVTAHSTCFSLEEEETLELSLRWKTS